MNAVRDSLYADCARSLDATGAAGLEALRGAHLFVTGATGFVGSWLLTLLAHLNDDHDFGLRVTGLARRPSRLAEQAPFLATRDDLTLLMADVRQYFAFPADAAYLVHAAAVPDSRHHASSPIDTASVIGEGTARVLRLAEQSEALCQLLHFSSGLVHAGQENGHRVGPLSVYTEAKSYSEALCAAYRSQARIPVVIARPFTFMGPFQSLDAPWAANNFLHAALHGQALKLLGNGETARAYLYGSDMAVLALHQLVRGRSGETYDLGGTQPIPLIELAQTVVAQAGRPLEIRLNTAGRDVPSARLVPDMAASVKSFGFRPAFGPAEAVARTLAWHRAGHA